MVSVGHRVGVVGMMPVRSGQCGSGHLVDAYQQLRRVGGRHDLLNQAVNVGVTIRIDLRERFSCSFNR